MFLLAILYLNLLRINKILAHIILSLVDSTCDSKGTRILKKIHVIQI